MKSEKMETRKGKRKERKRKGENRRRSRDSRSALQAVANQPPQPCSATFAAVRAAVIYGAENVAEQLSQRKDRLAHGIRRIDGHARLRPHLPKKWNRLNASSAENVSFRQRIGLERRIASERSGAARTHSSACSIRRRTRSGELRSAADVGSSPIQHQLVSFGVAPPDGVHADWGDEGQEAGEEASILRTIQPAQICTRTAALPAHICTSTAAARLMAKWGQGGGGGGLQERAGRRLTGKFETLQTIVGARSRPRSSRACLVRSTSRRTHNRSPRCRALMAHPAAALRRGRTDASKH